MARKPQPPTLRTNSSGIYEVHWNERTLEDGRQKTRTRRASTGTEDFFEAEIFLAEFPYFAFIILIA